MENKNVSVIASQDEKPEIKTATQEKKPRKTLTQEQIATLQVNIAKARQKANELRELRKQAGIEQTNKKTSQEKDKTIKHEELKKLEEQINKEEPLHEEEEEIIIKKKPNTKKKQVIVYESDSSSEEEIVVKKKKDKKYKFTNDDIEDMKKRELDLRLKQRQEYDELTRMEDEQLKRQYRDKLNLIRMEQLKGFLCPQSNFRRK